MPKSVFQRQFSTSKIIRIFLIFFFIEEYKFRSTFLDKINFSTTLLLKWCPIFDSSPLIQNSIISFGYVDSYAKIFLILYPPLANSTNHIAIFDMHAFSQPSLKSKEDSSLSAAQACYFKRDHPNSLFWKRCQTIILFVTSIYQFTNPRFF